MSRSVCVIGDMGQWEEEILVALTMSGLEPEQIEPLPDAVSRLEVDPPAAVLLGADLRDRRTIIASLHERTSLYRIPVLVQVPGLRPDLIERVFLDGADDFLVDGAMAQFAALLDVLEKADPTKAPPAPTDAVLVAAQDRKERIRLGRVLRRNGFAIHFAADVGELDQTLQSITPRAVVTSASLPGGTLVETIKGSCDNDSASPAWVIVKTEHEHNEASLPDSALGELPSTVVIDRSGDAERLTFLMNEILTPPPPNVRKTPRLLYETPISFLAEAEEDTFFGYSYNINLDGVFIRTLTPPAAETSIQVRFQPPTGRGDVVAGAKVMWRKSFGDWTGSASPVGMGVMLTEWALPDRAAYETGYDILLKEHQAMKKGRSAADSTPPSQ